MLSALDLFSARTASVPSTTGTDFGKVKMLSALNMGLKIIGLNNQDFQFQLK